MTPSPLDNPGETRRDRHRRELVDQLCDEARLQLVTGGAGSVTWRGLARSVGMSPASLYTYFDGIDALFTELILRSYGALAASTEMAAAAFGDASVGDQILLGPLAYRYWALGHRAEFNLVFTDQLPGYTAEPGGSTVDAQMAIFRPMTKAIAAALGEDVSEPDEQTGDVLQSALGLWGLFHGLVSLEVNHHLDWLDARETYEGRLRWAIDAAGLPPARAELAEEFDLWAESVDRCAD
jgi:AcrR family transcriptional regulator